jgi:two-component sensor histidine kinase
VITIVASSLLLGGALRTQRLADEQIREHFENVLALRRTQALLVDAETGQRGFLLTGHRDFLAPYSRARVELPTELRALARTAGSASDERLATLGFAKMRELELTLQLTESGHKDAAIAVVAAGKGKGYMDAVRTETARRVAFEQAQINGAILRSERYTTRTYLSLGVLLLASIVLLWLGLSMLLRTQRLEAETVRLREVQEAERRTALVARELNHRVKNLFSIVLAIVQLASRGATSPKDTVARIRERIQALARAHEVSLGSDPLARFDLETMLKTILAPYAADGAELELSGPEIRLPVMRVTPLGLIIHELATNAIKYGAWSAEGGRIAVNWSIGQQSEQVNGTPAACLLRLDWIETGTEPLRADGQLGFGSKLINAAVAQLDGSIARERGEHGLRIVIDAPIIPIQCDRV